MKLTIGKKIAVTLIWLVIGCLSFWGIAELFGHGPGAVFLIFAFVGLTSISGLIGTLYYLKNKKNGKEINEKGSLPEIVIWVVCIPLLLVIILLGAGMFDFY